jgi:magnesium chelatase family protein
LLAGLIYGIEGQIVELQARAVSVLAKPQSWPMAVSITGMEREAGREALLRVNAALAKYALAETPVAIQVNCTPATLPKSGSWLDLGLAILLLQAAGHLPDWPSNAEKTHVLVGELGLHGEVRRVPGILAIAQAAGPEQVLVVPAGNERECALVATLPEGKRCRIAAVQTLAEVIDYFRGQRPLNNILGRSAPICFEAVGPEPVDFGRIKGQEQAKEAAVLCAAGGHNLLLVGPPGEGKSLLAGAIAGILPPLSTAERVELTRIYSAAGQLERDGQIISQRPFRAVHHTISREALVGGGSRQLRPGEVTLAHLGILFLDELPEFRRDTLESLRQPLESGEVTISRTHATATFPCRFTLVAAMNPCPCGYAGTARCTCSRNEIARYRHRLSGPLLDRIDLYVELQPLTLEQRLATTAEGESPRWQAAVLAARARQAARLAPAGLLCNAAIPAGRIFDFCQFAPTGWERYKQTIDRPGISTRLADRLARVARTIADVHQSDTIEPEHVDRAAIFVLAQRLGLSTTDNQLSTP